MEVLQSSRLDMQVRILQAALINKNVMEDKEYIEMNITDAIIERPFGFSVGGYKLFLYPITLGKIFLLSRLLNELDINDRIMSSNPYVEALRLCETKKDVVCRILSYHTFKRKIDIFDETKVDRRMKLFADSLNEEELATLLVLVISGDNTELFFKHLDIDKDIQARKKISTIREDKGCLTFGGHSAYGALVDPACQRYGWTMDYVVWGISYSSLKMLFADKMETISLNAEEMKKLHIFDNKNYINADDPANKELIRELIND